MAVRASFTLCLATGELRKHFFPDQIPSFVREAIVSRPPVDEYLVVEGQLVVDVKQTGWNDIAS